MTPIRDSLYEYPPVCILFHCRGLRQTFGSREQIVEEFLKATEIIDWTQPLVSSKARELSTGLTRAEDIARNCFEWVRDEIQHSSDFKRNPVTCRASDVLAAGTGYCYAKSHLLAALLRANGIPTGFCYQRLSIDDRGCPILPTRTQRGPFARNRLVSGGLPRKQNRSRCTVHATD